MSTQQDIYAAGSENRPPMLNKENYVPWSSCLFRYAKSIPNGKLIYNSIINGPYVRRMIPEPGDANREVEADDQAIQTILLGLPEDIYAAVDMFHQDQPSPSTYMQQPQPNNNYSPQPSFNQNFMQQPMTNPKDILDPKTAMNMALVLVAKAFKLNYSTPTNNNQRISSNPHNRQIAQPGNQDGYNAVYNVGNQNSNGNGNVVAARAEGNAAGNNGVDNTAKTRRPQPRSNTKNDRVHSASKNSCNKNKEVKVEEHPRNLLLSKNKKHMSSECNNIKLAISNDKSEVVYSMCKQCLSTANHDVCVLNFVNDMNSRGKKQKVNVSNTENQKKLKPMVMKPKKVRSNERLASSKSSKPRSYLRWSPTRRLFDLKGKIITSGTVRFRNDHVAAILGFSDLQWGNILITRVYFVKGLGHNLFSVGQFYDSDSEVTLRRNICFVKNLEGVDLLKGNRTTKL
nr:integrase, catalytic region, zinc finger, CCHC-type, peptidase aspartic, catalytic [Tanacetum cinerariifolium]